MSDKELTQSQLDRCDAVDAAIHQLLLELTGKTEDELEQDMEHIGDIRDAVQEVICDRLKIMSPMDFYPWIKSCGNCDCYKSDNVSPLGTINGSCSLDGSLKPVSDEGCCERWKNDKEAWTQPPQAKEPETDEKDDEPYSKEEPVWCPALSQLLSKMHKNVMCRRTGRTIKS